MSGPKLIGDAAADLAPADGGVGYAVAAELDKLVKQYGVDAVSASVTDWQANKTPVARRRRVAALWGPPGSMQPQRSAYTGRFRRQGPGMSHRDFLRRFAIELIGRPVKDAKDENAAKQALFQVVRKVFPVRK